jgi:NSS family neurotransmitter:Na+ symporter
MTLYFGDEAHRVIHEAGFHDAVIYLSSHILQPLVALFVTLFVGWVIPRKVSFAALGLANRKQFELWNFSMRYITPILMFIVLLSTLGVVHY